jgi:hypothetical protein
MLKILQELTSVIIIGACSLTYPKTVFDERIISDAREGLT